MWTAFSKAVSLGETGGIIKGKVFDVAEFCYKCTDFYHPGDESGFAWNDPEIGIIWPDVVGEYRGNASADGYRMKDGIGSNLSEKEQKWRDLNETFMF